MGGRGASGRGLKTGQGISMKLNGRQQTFWLDVSGKLRNLVTTKTIPGGKEAAQKLIQSGKATVLSKEQVENMRAARFEERKNRPDYETGNPFHERGKKKLVYRPRRRR